MYKTSPRRGRPTPEKNITIEFPGVKVKISTEGLTLEALEELIFDIGRGIEQRAMIGALGQYDEILRKERPRGLLENICKKLKYLQTRIGCIQYKRTLYKEKATGKPRYLLDEKLKIHKNQRMSLKIAQIFGTLASVGDHENGPKNNHGGTVNDGRTRKNTRHENIVFPCWT